MLDLVNALACAVMLILTFPVAVAMNAYGHHFQRVLFALVVVVLSLQVVAPVYGEFLPNATWLQTGFNLMLMVATIVGRKHIMTLVRLTVGEGRPPTQHPLRRADDLDSGQFSRVHGRGVEH